VAKARGEYIALFHDDCLIQQPQWHDVMINRIQNGAFAGIEDVDFSCQIINKGHKVEQIIMPYKHFNGMSTVILLNDQSELIKTLFGYCLITEKAIENWKNKVMHNSDIIILIQGVNGENLKYFKTKNSFTSDKAKKDYKTSLTTTDFPALFSIQKDYKIWLEKQFKIVYM